MKSFKKQFCECKEQGYLNEIKFESFEEHPEILPAFPWKKRLKPMMDAIKSGELKGLNKYICGRFGGDCNSGHDDCRKMREISQS